MTGNLTAKQILFCAEYSKDLNCTQAAIRAGYSKNSARQQGARLLSNAAIRKAIDQQLERRIEEVKYDATALLLDALEVFHASRERALRSDAEAKDVMAFKGMAEVIGKHVDVNAFKETIDHNHKAAVGTITRRIVDTADTAPTRT